MAICSPSLLHSAGSQAPGKGIHLQPCNRKSKSEQVLYKTPPSTCTFVNKPIQGSALTRVVIPKGCFCWCKDTTCTASIVYYTCTYSPYLLASFPGLPRFFCSSISVSVHYCQRKPKNRKNGVGLGTRLVLALFPGLPCFFCSSVSVDNNTRIRKQKNRKNGVGLGTRLFIYYTDNNNR